jgi:hypothetical protein
MPLRWHSFRPVLGDSLKPNSKATPAKQVYLKRILYPLLSMVPRAGLEPALDCSKRILSPQRLPIPPPGHLIGKMEARVGIEPAYTELQSAA